MEKATLVSIALCTYNGDKYLAEQLDTLVNQSYTPVEIVVVDESQDNTTSSLFPVIGMSIRTVSKMSVVE